MGPWTPYDFDITAAARAGANDIEVEVTIGECRSGRSAHGKRAGGLSATPTSKSVPIPYIANAHLQYKLEPDSAHCNLTVYVIGQKTGTGKVRAELWREGIKGARLLAQSP